MHKISMLAGLAAYIGVAVAGAADAQVAPVVIPQVELEVGRMKLVPEAPLAGAAITKIEPQSSSIVDVHPYRSGQVQIVAKAPGRTLVSFFNATTRTPYQVTVWVNNSSKLSSPGYDQTKVQLPQVVMLPNRTEYRAPPGPGTPHISRPVASNPSVVAVDTNTSGTEQLLRIFSRRLGDSWVDFANNGIDYQIHVWVVSDPKFIPPPAPVPGGGKGKPGPGPHPMPAPVAPGRMDACLVGTWRSQQISLKEQGFGGVTGGAGIMLTIKPDGRITVDYDGMRPIVQPIPGGRSSTNQLSGSASGQIGASGGIARVVKVVSANLVHKVVDPQGRTQTNSLGMTLGYGAPGTNPPTYQYSCSASKLVWDDIVHSYLFEREKK
jgi:hypothetical protein